jgi:cytoskeletal protein CcmA (bactofilin family)
MKVGREDAGNAINSIIGAGSTFNGVLNVQGGLRVDGLVDGEVSVSATLTVGHEGRIKGEITVAQAVIGGTINGTIRAENQLELQNGSRVEGDIFTRSLIIEEGVFFQGHCSMSGKDIPPKG